MRAMKEIVVIMSPDLAQNKDLECVKLSRRAGMRNMLKDMQRYNEIRFRAAEGVYKGESERSYVVVIENSQNSHVVLNRLLEIARHYQQESVLVRYPECVDLVYLGYRGAPDVHERIGRDLYKVEFDGDVRPDAYTITNGQAWVVA